MTIEDLRKSGLIVLECISGSRAYGLDTPTSDTDIKGVFVLPKSEYYGLNYSPQISNISISSFLSSSNKYFIILSSII